MNDLDDLYKTTITLDPKARNYRLGVSTSVISDSHGHWTIELPEEPTTGNLSALGMAHVLNQYAQNLSTTYWSVALWRGDTLIVRGLDAIRRSIQAMEWERHEASERRKGHR